MWRPEFSLLRMVGQLRVPMAAVLVIALVLTIGTLQRTPSPFRAFGALQTHRGTPSIGKISMLWGKQAEQDVYRRALQTHQAHAERHGYSLHVLQESVAHHYWNKLYWILTVLVDELSKPEAERVGWMMWSDADTIMLNQAQRLDLFLPPSKEKSVQNVHLVCTKDSNGLNNGVFFIRVSQHSVRYMASAIALPIYMPEVELPWPEQTAMWHVLQQPEFRDEVVYVPRHWVNAYQQDIEQGSGALLVHFAGVSDRKKKMREWLDRIQAGANLVDWNSHDEQAIFESQVHDFWRRTSEYRRISRHLEVSYSGNASEVGEVVSVAAENFRDAVRQETHNEGRMQVALGELRQALTQSNGTRWLESLTPRANE